MIISRTYYKLKLNCGWGFLAKHPIDKSVEIVASDKLEETCIKYYEKYRLTDLARIGDFYLLEFTKKSIPINSNGSILQGL